MKAFVSAAAISLLACTAAHAQTNPLLGNWRIVSAGVAPWIGADKILTIKEDDARRFVKQKISFTADQVKSRDPLLACKGPRYEPTKIPPAGLFQGNLPEPKADVAKALGFPAGEVAGDDERKQRRGAESEEGRDQDLCGGGARGGHANLS